MSVVRSSYMIKVGGKNVTSTFAPILISLSVSDKAGTHSDTATITVDDTGAHVRLPRTGDKVVISIGSSSSGLSEVFRGTVDEAKADGNRSSGRTVTVTAKGVDTTKKAKEPQQRHFDDDTVQGILDKAAKDADIKKVTIKDGLGSAKRKYLEMRDESFIHLGERLAREIGGNFKIRDDEAIITKRNGTSEGSISAVWGKNLHSYSISPKLGRPQFNKTKGRWYDKEKAKWQENEKSTSVKNGVATIVHRYILPDEDEAGQNTDSAKATTERDAGDGTVTIELNPGAKPDGECVVKVGKKDVDGTYSIETVTHTINRGSGGGTSLSINHPKG